MDSGGKGREGGQMVVNRRMGQPLAHVQSWCILVACLQRQIGTERTIAAREKPLEDTFVSERSLLTFYAHSE
jgi:hypothetical protein